MKVVRWVGFIGLTLLIFSCGRTPQPGAPTVNSDLPSSSSKIAVNQKRRGIQRSMRASPPASSLAQYLGINGE